MSLDRLKQPPSKFPIVLIALIPLLCAASARADTFFDITIINATFSSTCLGGSGTCTEVVNGSFTYDADANMASDISMALAGSLNTSLGGFYNGSGTNPCVNNSANCLPPDYVYDSGAQSGDNPIQFSIVLSPVFELDAPTPEALEGGSGNTELFVPGSCGGDQPSW